MSFNCMHFAFFCIYIERDIERISALKHLCSVKAALHAGIIKLILNFYFAFSEEKAYWNCVKAITESRNPIKIDSGNMAKDSVLSFQSEKSRTQGSRPKPRRRTQKNPRPRTGMLKAKDQGHKRKCSPKKSLQNFFSGYLRKKRSGKKFSADLKNFNNPKSSVVLEPRTGQFSRT